MKKVLFLICAAIFSVSASAQSFWKTDDCDNFNLIQAGFARESNPGGNGFFVGYKHGWNITGEKLPLYIEPGAELRFESFGASCYDIGVTVPIDFSYKFKTGDFSISPITGPTLGYLCNFGDGWSALTKEHCFTLGWDFGARLAYKKFTLEYRYNKGLLNSSTVWATHQLGIGFLF